MATTPYMSLALPTVSLTLGPAWATQLNAALALVDSHTHVSGQGLQVPTAGLNINADLSFGGFNATQLRTARLAEQGGTLSSVGDARCLYATGGNLWYNNGAGTAVQLTSGGSIVGTAGSIGGLASPAAVTYTSVDTRFAFTGSASTAAQLDAGPVTIRTMTAGANGITLQSPNALAAPYAVTLPGALPAGPRIVTLDSAGVLAAAWNVDGATVQVAGNLLQAINVTATGVNASATIRGNRAAADAGADVVVNSQATRVSGLLLTVQNGGLDKFSIDASGNLWLRSTAMLGVVAVDADSPVTLSGNRNAASTTSDVIVSTRATRTLGYLLDVQNNGTSALSVNFRGTLVSAAVVSAGIGTIVTSVVNNGLAFFGNKNAADAGADIVFTGQATRTAGLLLDVQNNGVSKVGVQFDGQVRLSGVATVFAAGANASATLQGNRSAADAGADIILTSAVTRTAGNLLDVQNGGASQWSVNYAGHGPSIWRRVVLTAGTDTGVGLTPVDITGASFPVVSGKKYLVRCVIFIAVAANGGNNVGISAKATGAPTVSEAAFDHFHPGGGTFSSPTAQQGPIDTLYSGFTDTPVVQATGSGGSQALIANSQRQADRFDGYFVATSAGTFQLRFAQNVNAAGFHAIAYQGSYIEYCEF